MFKYDTSICIFLTKHNINESVKIWIDVARISLWLLR